MTDELRFLAKVVAAGKLDRRAFLGRAAALGISASLAGTLLATQVKAAGPVKGGTFRVGLGGGQSSDTLDPALATNEVPNIMLSFFGEKLTEARPDGTVEPRLAASYDASDDAKVWTFKIRDGVTFHNGKTVTAEDVLATFKRHASEDSKSAALGLLAGVDTMAADGDEFIVTLKDPNADFAFVVADYHLVIQPQESVSTPDDGIGCGPYKITVAEHGIRYVFERHPDYWDSNRAHVDTIEVIVINDDTARVSALQSGQVHMINRVPPRISEMVSKLPNVSVKSVASRGHYPFVMQVNQKPFDNYDLRQALKYAVNREEMVDKILFGHGSAGNDIPINEAYPFYPAGMEQRTYDPDKAAFHFKKSGHDGPVTLYSSDVAFPGALDAGQLFQQSAATAGITIDLQRRPGDGYWSEIWNVVPFCMSYWNGRPTQDMMYSTAYLTGADWNETRFSNADFDKLIISARGELDPAKRQALYHDAAVILHDQGGLLCPMFGNFIDAISGQVEGWTDDPNFPLMNGLAPIKCWLSA